MNRRRLLSWLIASPIAIPVALKADIAKASLRDKVWDAYMKYRSKKVPPEGFCVIRSYKYDSKEVLRIFETWETKKAAFEKVNKELGLQLSP